MKNIVVITSGKVRSPRQRVVGGVRVVQPEVVLSTGESLRELDDVPDVFRCDGGVRGGMTEGGIVVQTVHHPILSQIAGNVYN